MENIKLRISVNLKTGKYVFDDGEKVMTMSMKSGDTSLLQEMKTIKDELVDEYGFSAGMISRVDPILYERLKEYDEKNETSYNTRYLNVVAKEVERKENEPLGVYLDRCSVIRKKALQDIGIEIDYVIAKLSEMKGMMLLDKLELIRMAKRQVAIGATLSDKSDYEEYEDIQTIIKDSKVVENLLSEDMEPQGVRNETIVDESIVEPEEIVESKMIIPSFLQEVLDKREALEEPLKIDTEIDLTAEDAETVTIKAEGKKEKTEVGNKTVQTAKKKISRRQSIQASKKAMRESRKMKNVYKQKVNKANNPNVSNTQSQKTKAQEAERPCEKKKEIDFIPIKDGKMVGIDENRPSAIVKTFVLEAPEKEKKIAAVEQEEVKLEPVISAVPRKDGIVHRYTRKLKNKADSIRNKLAMSKDRFRRATAVAAVCAVVVVAGVIAIPKAIASIPLGTEQASEIIIQAYDGMEEVSAKELQTNAEAPIIEISEASNELENDVSSYIRDFEYQSTGIVNGEETLSAANTQTVETVEKELVENTKEESQEKSIVQAIEYDSASYLESVKVGSRMTIDSGKYFENPDGSGNYGRFENHIGEAKILSQIGIATNEGYVSISSDDVSLLELKQKYPDAKFSYHFTDEKGHILGWLTSESLENMIEQQVDDGMDR